ncbi:unannotated protein [freshwater metagenome]|uniref:Unannotated protein n=1 Tax=freshwater metagenome TaxID=449393 RepID=A0A6J7EXY7_9ZZZZ|nr:hypothetical protein [Actinomycetota bacterium]
MSALIRIAHLIASEKTPHQDSEGITTSSWIWPEKAELIYGVAASLIIFAMLFKFAGPAIKKGMSARTARIQKELDDAAGDKASAQTEAIGIRQAKGDIGAERDRLLADAAVQAGAMLTDGRGRLETEVAEMKARALADIETARGRSADELRGEIARLSSTAAERAVAESIDDSTHQDLIEAFIQKVGASS